MEHKYRNMEIPGKLFQYTNSMGTVIFVILNNIIELN